MKLFKGDYFKNRENPTPTQFNRIEVLTKDDKAWDLGGISVVLPASVQVPYHVHERRESILIILSGEPTAIIDGKETEMKAGDVIFIPPAEKHSVINKSQNDVRFLEFFTYPPVTADFTKVEGK